MRLWPFKRREVRPPDVIDLEKSSGMRCPDCECREFYEGPEGGAAINVQCANPKCSAKFNSLGGEYLMERLTDPTPCGHGRFCFEHYGPLAAG